MRMIAIIMGLLLTAAQAAAQPPQVVLEFNGSLVTLHALNAPVSLVLAEWSRLGGTTVVNGDRLAGRTLTLELTDVPERRALDLVLRGVAGYLLAQRADGARGRSAFGRLVVLPTSSVPAVVPPATAAVTTGGPH